MNLFLLVLGSAILALTVVDLLWTTLWADGAAGPLTSRYTSAMWFLMRRMGGPRSRWLSLAGPVIVAATLFAWVALLWGGWALVFASGSDALVDARDRGAVGWVERLYFVAYTLFTMGNGDFSPRDGWPQIATSLTTASGMLFVTMAVSYVLSVLGAVNQKRAFAGAVRGLGRRAEDVVVNAWNGHDLHRLELPLNSLASQLSLLADQHKSYPVLHYYHSEKAEDASAMAVAVLDEALTLVLCAVPAHARNELLLGSTRSSVSSYLRTLHSAFIRRAAAAPPPPDLGVLRGAGVPTVPDQSFAQSLQALEERRALLLGLVEGDAWHWPTSRDP